MDPTFKENFIRGNRPVRIALVATLGMLTLYLLVQTIDGLHNWGHEDTNPPNTITVTGQGTATAIPDTATISFTVTGTANDVATAESQMTTTVNAALAAIKAQGVSSSDVTTTSYNVSPHYSSPVCPPGLFCPATTGNASGYDVSESVQVNIHDTTKVAAILAGLASANVTNVTGPDFVVADPTMVQGEARAQAIQKAQADAQLLASQLGVHLGPITDFQDNSNGTNPPTPVFSASSAVAPEAASAPSVPVGNNTYTDNVSITYEIN